MPEKSKGKETMAIYLLKWTAFFSEPAICWGTLHAQSLLDKGCVSVSHGADVDTPVKESVWGWLRCSRKPSECVYNLPTKMLELSG